MQLMMHFLPIVFARSPDATILHEVCASVCVAVVGSPLRQCSRKHRSMLDSWRRPTLQVRRLQIANAVTYSDTLIRYRYVLCDNAAAVGSVLCSLHGGGLICDVEGCSENAFGYEFCTVS